MNPLTIAHLAHALGWTLLHFCWQGALVALILACVRSLLSGRSAQPRYLAACCALLLIVALPVVTFIQLITAPQTPEHTTFFLTINSAITDATITTPQQPLLQRIAASLDHALPTLLIIWSAGVLLLLTRLTIGLIVAGRMKSATTQQAPRDLLQTFNHLARRIGVSRPIRLLNSALVQVPTVIGWLRPVVLIPLGCLSGLSSTQIEAVLAHELAHIRRHDYLISVLQSIVEAVLFYHPAVWWISQQIRREREHCCDDLAVTITGDPLTYARALSLLEEHRSTLPAIALGANGGILTMRIKRLLTPTQNPASQLTALTILGLVIATTAACITTAAHAQKTSTTTTNLAILTEDRRGPEPAVASNAHRTITRQPATNTQQLATAYQSWLDQDVRWIITPEERNTFIQLTTNEQRDTYIQQFWISRDTNAPANSYRAEHYQRIAYANQHFTAAGNPGWASDRGHIFIVDGPPSTIDSHPSAAPGGHPYETWRYNATPTGQPAEFNFIDTCNCGSYQLQSQSGSGGTTSTGISQLNLTVSSRDSGSSYPPIARAAHVSGTVELFGTTSKNGTIEDLKIISGPQMLRASAMQLVKGRAYRPLLVNGSPADVPTKIEVTFILDETAKSQPQPAPINNSARPTLHTASYNPPATAQQSIAPSNPAKISAGTMAGLKIFGVTPIYPPEAKAARIQGAVVIGVTIAKDGTIQSINSVTGPEQLQTSATDAVRQWRYQPYLLNGQPTEVLSTITVNYNFGDGDEEEASNTTPKKIGGAVSAPRVVSQVPPEYTAEAREKKISGKVLVHLWVDEQGIPSHIHVTRGLDKGLDQKAIEAIKQYKFTPAMEDGHPVTVELTIEVNFQFF